MKRIFLFIFSLSLINCSNSQTNDQPVKDVAIIPAPVSIEKGSGNFTLKNSTAIQASSGEEAQRVASFLSKALGASTGYPFPVNTASNASDVIDLKIVKDASIPAEGYQLQTTTEKITISANDGAGLFYGVQTLLQLLPKEIENSEVLKNVDWTVSGVTIKDYPRFGWRGLMLDVSRHFFTKEEVKQFIDDMVRYKYNRLHLHLTDDQGWRIEIKSLPELTKVGAWRPTRKGKWSNTSTPDPSEPKDYGGFYTQEDIKELVKYAQERYVAILPEIDIPGHSLAAIASYPYLSCTPGKYAVNAGEKFMQWHGNGTFSALVDNNLCPANEKVYDFLDKVFTEVAQLFPFEYIHMGGDEAAKNMWEKSSAVKSLMAKEGLKNMEEVQSYFVKRVQKIIQSKGKKMMGWDEILEGGLASNASVMSWRGMKGGIEAAKMGHPVVMSPSTFAYLDYMQGDRIVEAPVYATLRMEQAYKFDPLPEGIDAKYILGGQGNLWTEQIQNMRSVQYMIWPRALAIAESVWSPKEKKNWEDFVQRVEQHFDRMDVQEIRYARSIYDPILSVSKKGTDLLVDIRSEIPGLDIYYSIDESNPDNYYPKYDGPFTLPKDAATLKIVTYKGKKQVGKQINYPVEELQKRAEKK